MRLAGEHFGGRISFKVPTNFVVYDWSSCNNSSNSVERTVIESSALLLPRGYQRLKPSLYTSLQQTKEHYILLNCTIQSMLLSRPSSLMLGKV